MSFSSSMPCPRDWPRKLSRLYARSTALANAPRHLHLTYAQASVLNEWEKRMVPDPRPLLFLVAAVASVVSAQAACPDNADALGTERVLTVDPATYPRVGRKHFPQTLPLRAREVILTFDDGPEPATTPRVLDALKR